MSTPTPRQQQVIEHDGHALVVAGPGSGKSTTLVEKMCRILSQPQTRIHAMTFTAAAADELGERLHRKLHERGQQDCIGRVRVGTFHSTVIRHLEAINQSPAGARYPAIGQFPFTQKGRLSFLAPAEQSALLDRAIAASSCPPANKEERELLRQQFEFAKGSLEPVMAIESLDWFVAYQEALARHRKLDLYDVMRLAVRLICSGELPTLPGTHLLIDEAQDTDAIQEAFAVAHAKVGLWVTLVGDDDQTIYEWRHAIGYGGMVRFAKGVGAAVITLGENFRSKARIVDASRGVIECNAARLGKDLVARRGPGGSVAVVGTPTDTAAAERIADFLVDRGSPQEDESIAVPTGRYAVLARTNALLDGVQAALSVASIRVYRPSKGLFESAPAQNMLALIRAVFVDDAMALEGQLHADGLSKGGLEALQGRSLSALLCAPIAMTSAADQELLSALTARAAIWRARAEKGEVAAVMAAIAARISMRARTAAQERTWEQITHAVADRISRLKGSLSQRLDAIARGGTSQSKEGAVQLYTMHGAKGLEFDCVFIYGANQNVTPGDTPDGDDPLASVAAERRLFYVAMTRAKDELFIYHATDPSKFIGEIPPGISTRSDQ